VKLRQNIDGTLALVPAEVGVDNRCEFGKWLYSLAGTPAATDPQGCGDGRHRGAIGR